MSNCIDFAYKYAVRYILATISGQDCFMLITLESEETWSNVNIQIKTRDGIPSKNIIWKSLGIIRLLFENRTPPPHALTNTHKQRERGRETGFTLSICIIIQTTV